MSELASVLACPTHRRALDVQDNDILCPRCGVVGRIVDGVYDFIGGTAYADSFGRQWEQFAATQLDSATATRISANRFHQVTRWSHDDLNDRRVLDAGCGAGRFTEVALGLGAQVTALDLSEAAYTTRRNLDDASLTVVRGDLLKPPLQRASFDKVFSIGVIHHTPDPPAAAATLLELVRPGGELVLWVYERRWYTPLRPKIVTRRLTRRLSSTTTERLAEVLVRTFTPLARAAASIPSPKARRAVHGLLPIASYWGQLPLTPHQQREWSLLDTRDWLTPTYDLPQTFDEIRRALLEAGAEEVRRLPAPGVTVLARTGGDS